MREGKDNKEKLYNNNDKFIGYNLGSDFCFEHEIGIEEMKFKFGIKEKFDIQILGEKIFSKIRFGIPSRKITNLPIHFSKGKLDLSSNTYYYIGTDLIILNFVDLIQKSSHKIEKEGFISFWDESDFLIVSDNKEDIDFMFDRFLRRDVIIYLHGNSPLNNGGLIICSPLNMDREARNSLFFFDKRRISD